MKSIKQKVVYRLKKKKLKISFVESCTGGLLSNTITSVAGSSAVFNFGLITYSDQSKIDTLKIPKNTIRKYGAVSKQVCLAMVKNLSKKSKADIFLSVTGIAGPGGGTKEKPVGLVFIGIKKGKKIKINKYLFKNKGRFYIQRAAVNESLKLILGILK